MALEDIVVIENFISEQDRLILLDYEKKLTEDNKWDQSGNDPKKQWTNRYLSVINLYSKESGFGNEHDIFVANLCKNIEIKIRKQIKQSWSLEKDIWPDSLNLIRWPHGQAQPPHSDHENFGGEPHIYNWRDIGCVLYLNDDFEDGHIYFPQHDKEIKIKAGMLAFFPGDIHHAHGVKEVKNGTRYTINTFYTFSEKHKFEVINNA